MKLRSFLSQAGAVCLTVFVTALWTQPAFAARTPSCEGHALRAEKDAGIPTFLLAAISRTETGHTRRGRGFGAWPWTLNIAGKGYYFDTKEEAIAAMRKAMAGGTTSIDVGCMQLNYRWHGDAFSSLEEMFDPTANTAYAAEFLTRLKKQNGSWEEAVKHYHSGKDSLGRKYLQKVEVAFNALSKGDFPKEEVMLASAPAGESAAPPRKRKLSDMAEYIVKFGLPEGNLPKMPESGSKAIPLRAYDFSAPSRTGEDAAALMASLKASLGVGN